MAAGLARCVRCAAILPAKDHLFSRWWPLTGRQITCPACGHAGRLADARIMGDSFTYWVGQLQSHLRQTCQALPVLTDFQALAAIAPGLPPDQVRTVPSIEALAHYLAQLCRAVLCDQAHGRDGRLEIVLLEDGAHHQAAGILGRTSAEAGAQEREALVARVGPERFIIYTPNHPTGRVAEALRGKHHAEASAPKTAPS